MFCSQLKNFDYFRVPGSHFASPVRQKSDHAYSHNEKSDSVLTPRMSARLAKDPNKKS